MRYSLAVFLLLSACSQGQQQTDSAISAGTFSGQGRDRLCVSSVGDAWHVGIVTYGEGDFNCTMRGQAQAAADGMVVQATGDPACRISIAVAGDKLTSSVPDAEACSYYCGPTASLAGKSFERDAASSPVVDLAGDPLC